MVRKPLRRLKRRNKDSPMLVSWGDKEEEGTLNCREVERRRDLEVKGMGP